ncbi:MAG: hypothetical protein GY801_44350 [bacterium]|nr:hypothetical protein [bacterium]
MVKKFLKTLLLWGIMLLLLYPLTFLIDKPEKGQKDAITLRTELQSLEPQEVSVFKIYPRISKPVNTPLVFRVPEPLIEDFFHALTDLSTYRYNHDTVQSPDHSWCLEVVAENAVFQVEFHIPVGRGNIVAVELGAYRTGGTGYFQSRQLYHWYQKYSHRWLEPDESQPTPTPRPDPPGGE